MATKIWLSSPHLSGNELHRIEDILSSNWVAPAGPVLATFEATIGQFLSSKCVVLNSGTAAIHLALILLGVKDGDVVLVQSHTNAASAFPVVYQRATCVFVDSEMDTWNMCPEALAASLATLTRQGKNVSAIIVVDIYGMPAKMDEIKSIADRYGIPVIEDAAEALGSRFKGAKCGTLGDLGVVSFNGNKIITTGGGGVLVSQDEHQIARAKILASQSKEPTPFYQHLAVGYNYRMSSIAAGIGQSQMEVLEDRIFQRRSNNQRYRKYFEKLPGISFQNEPSEDYFSNYWLTSILVDPDQLNGLTKEVLRLALLKWGIESRPTWKPMHLQPIFDKCQFFGSGVCEDIFQKGLCLPSGSNLTDDNFDRIFACLETVFN